MSFGFEFSSRVRSSNRALGSKGVFEGGLDGAEGSGFKPGGGGMVLLLPCGAPVASDGERSPSDFKEVEYGADTAGLASF